MSKSEQLFQQAQNTIPGGVNSPVRAFKALAVHLFLLIAPTGLICTMSMAKSISTI